MVLDKLEPKEVFKYFEEICNIPHGSGNVEKISDYLVTFAKEHNLKYRQDEKFNVIIWKDATSGYENSDGVIIQGHIDMVAVKDDTCTKNMDTDGLDLLIEGDYVTADQTSLGGDDGIAVAYMLAILSATDIAHPKVTCIFTVDEEIGMLGAAAIDLSDVDARIMLNVDSEDEGIFLAGCAGGATVRAAIPAVYDQVSGIQAKLSLTGLVGGHSGIEIISQRANANVLIGRVLNELSKEVTFGITELQGGEKDNAIAKFCNAKLVLEAEDKSKAEEIIKKCNETIRHEFANTDPDMQITIAFESDTKEYSCLNQASITKLITALLFMPAGILRMSTDIEGLVQTSLNLGIVTLDQEKAELCYSVRSSVKSEKDHLIDRIEYLAEFLGGSCSVSGAYPAWEFKKDSKIRALMSSVYEKMYGSKPEIQTIHAGVECGLMSEKLEGLDCISYGPQMIGIHTTKEKLSISSVKRTWELTVEVLKEMK